MNIQANEVSQVRQPGKADLLNRRPCSLRAPFSSFMWRTTPMRKLVQSVLAIVCAVVLMPQATAQAPGGQPAENPREKAKDYSNSAIVIRMMAFDKNKDGKLTKDEV